MYGEVVVSSRVEEQGKDNNSITLWVALSRQLDDNGKLEVSEF
jgi:hypothetical protein